MKTHSKSGNPSFIIIMCSPFAVPRVMPSSAVANISLLFGIKGESYDISAACTSSALTIIAGARLIQSGEYDCVMVGGSEEVSWQQALGFNAMHALSHSYCETPETASRPFDKQRDGFIMGEGGTILVLEEYEHAKARGAKIYAEVAGYGASCDGYHLTAPNPDGVCGAKAMTIAMKDAGVKPEDVTYYNAHGTSTHLNDSGETQMLHMAFGDAAKNLKISSTKSMTGHCLGNAGSLEAMVCVKAIQEGFIPPTINLDEVDVEGGCDLDYTPNKGVEMPVNVAMSGNFGFGGHNGILVFKKVE